MQNYDIKEVGKRIKKTRMRAGLTQEQLAQRLEINIDHIGKIERGLKGISIDLAVALAIQLHVSLDFLLLGRNLQTDEMKRKIYEMIDCLEEVAKSL